MDKTTINKAKNKGDDELAKAIEKKAKLLDKKILK